MIPELELFTKRMQQARRDLGWSLEQLSKMTGINRTSLWRWEVGMYAPNAVDLATICRAMGISADWLLGLYEEVSP